MNIPLKFNRRENAQHMVPQTAVIKKSLCARTGRLAHRLLCMRLKTFPKSRYDDRVNSTSQALGWLKQGCPRLRVL